MWFVDGFDVFYYVVQVIFDDVVVVGYVGQGFLCGQFYVVLFGVFDVGEVDYVCYYFVFGIEVFVFFVGFDVGDVQFDDFVGGILFDLMFQVNEVVVGIKFFVQFGIVYFQQFGQLYQFVFGCGLYVFWDGLDGFDWY